MHNNANMLDGKREEKLQFLKLVSECIQPVNLLVQYMRLLFI